MEQLRFNPDSGKMVPVYVFLGNKKAEAKALEHDLKEKERRAALGLGGGARTYLGTFAELCEKAHEYYFKGRRGAREDVSRLNRYGGANIERPSVGEGRKRKAKAKPKVSRPGDDFVSTLGPQPARHLTAADFNLFFRSLEGTLTCRGKVMPGTSINRVRETLAKVFDVASAFKLWPEGDNPARASRKLEEVRVTPVVYRPEWIEPMLAQVSPYWLGCCVVALTSALRKGELFGLLKADVDLAARVFLIWRSHDNDITKGGTGERVPVPIDESAMPFVLVWLDSPGPYLFPDENGERRKETIKTESILRAAMARAGIVTHYEHVCRRKGCGHREDQPDDGPRRCPAPMPGDPDRICGFKLWPVGKAHKINFRAARSTAATQMLKDGVPLAFVQKILRHQDPATTMRYYALLGNEDLVAQMARRQFPSIAVAEAPWLEVTGVASQGNGAEPVPTEANRATAIEHPELSRTASAMGSETVRAGAGHGDAAGDLAFWADYGSSMFLGGLAVEPTGIEPVTCALRMQANQAVSLVTASQAFVNIGIVDPGFATGSLAFSPVISTFRAGTGHSVNPEPGARPDCTGAGSAPRPPAAQPAALLTVRDVAARLRVSTARVYALIESGELTHLRLGNNTIRVSEADLAAYLARGQR